MGKNKKNKYPKIGDSIYVDSCYHVYRGEDDFEGGLAVINKVKASDHLPSDHYNYWMVGIEGRPSAMYNWRYLMERQDELKKEFGDKKAYANPDYRPEFNCPNDDWKLIN